jgi:prevent-host-death family protein
MTFDLAAVLASKRAYRSRLASLPIAEKLRLLDALRERAVALHQAGADAAPMMSQPLAEAPNMDYIESTLSPEATVRYSSQVKPISYLKANAAEVLRTLAESREPLLITQNGKARAVIQDVASYEETQETLALLKILALGDRDLEQGKISPVEEVVGRVRKRRKAGA